MFLVFFPIIVIPILHSTVYHTKIKKCILLSFVLSLLCAFFSILINVDYASVKIIAERVQFTPESGAFFWLFQNTEYALLFVCESIVSKSYIPLYGTILVLASLAYLPLRASLNYLLNDKLTITLLILSFFGTLGLFIIAIDWGRFIYIWAVILFFLSFKDTPSVSPKFIYMKRYLVLVIPCYFITWYIPHCCSSTLLNKFIRLLF